MQLVTSLVPDGEYEIDGYTVTVKRSDHGIEIHAESSWDDEIKSKASHFKECIEELEDCLFVKIAEDIGKRIDSQKFNTLLEQEKLTKDESRELDIMLNIAIKMLRTGLQDHIEKMVKLFEKI